MPLIHQVRKPEYERPLRRLHPPSFLQHTSATKVFPKADLVLKYSEQECDKHLIARTRAGPHNLCDEQAVILPISSPPGQCADANLRPRIVAGCYHPYRSGRVEL